MSKATSMAKVSAKGGFNLLWGMVVSTAISAIGTIFVARILGSGRFGLYAIALTGPNLISLFMDWGISVAIIKYTAQYRAENNSDLIRNILISGLIFETSTGLALTVLSFLLSGFLAASVLRQPTIAPLIEIASLSILMTAFVTVATSAFTGFERMELTSITTICNSVVRTILVPLLVIFGFGIFGAVTGNTVAVLASGVIAMLLLWTLQKNLPKNGRKLEIRATITTLLKYGLPLAVSSIMGGILGQFTTFLLAIHYSGTPAVVGNYSIATSFAVLISFLATPIGTVLFPAFSKLDYRKEQETLKNVFQFSVKYAALIVVPAATLIMVLSRPGISALLGNTYNAAPLFLSLLVIPSLYTACGSLSVVNLINSQGNTKFVMKLSILTSTIGFPLYFVLISQFGVIGLIASTLVYTIPMQIIALFWIKKNYRVAVDWASSIKILLSSALAAALDYVILLTLNFNSWILLLIGVIVFLPIFIMTIILTKAINSSDIANLREITGGLGAIGRIIRPILNAVEKLVLKFQK
jgi:O-antigen/teichoic acid export membrane protein